MNVRYKLLKDGGFVVVDDQARLGVYAYPTSEHASRANKPSEVESVVQEMLECAGSFKHLARKEVERDYLLYSKLIEE
jgi:hypothetical protein